MCESLSSHYSQSPSLSIIMNTNPYSLQDAQSLSIKKIIAISIYYG